MLYYRITKDLPEYIELKHLFSELETLKTHKIGFWGDFIRDK